MRSVPFKRSDGTRIEAFGSSFALAPVTDIQGTARVACFHLGRGDLVGEHRAVSGQLFCVVVGEGWVSGEDGSRISIRAYQAAHWARGERHAAGTETGMTALVIEGEGIKFEKPGHPGTGGDRRLPL